MRYLLPSHLRRDLERGRANLFGTHRHPDGREAIGCIRVCQEFGRVTAVRSLMLEILNRPLVRLCRTTRGERSEILTLSGLSVLFARIQTISASLQFSNHWTILVGPKQVASACPAPGLTSFHGGTTACRSPSFFRGSSHLGGKGRT